MFLMKLQKSTYQSNNGRIIVSGLEISEISDEEVTVERLRGYCPEVIIENTVDDCYMALASTPYKLLMYNTMQYNEKELSISLFKKLLDKHGYYLHTIIGLQINMPDKYKWIALKHDHLMIFSPGIVGESTLSMKLYACTIGFAMQTRFAKSYYRGPIKFLLMLRRHILKERYRIRNGR